MPDLITGATYYELSFADRELTMPGVKPLIYIGANLLEGDEEASTVTHYFQSTVSFARFGPATAYEGDEEVEVIPCSEDRLGDVLTLPDLMATLSSAAERAASLGYPRLKAGGKKARP